MVGAAVVLAAAFLPETYSVVLLRRRAEKLRKVTGDEGYMTEQERYKKPFSEVLKASMIRPLVILFAEPIVFLFSVSARDASLLSFSFFNPTDHPPPPPRSS